MHRDCVGSEQPIRPGKVNRMTAGRGIAHSEQSMTGAPIAQFEAENRS
jgi:quercetin 2,3-dioxygenase